MPPLELMISFVLAASIFAYMPGPAMLYTTAQTIARGKRAGWFAALGIHVGGYVHVAAAAAGLAFLFNAVPTAYLALKLAGAAYLIWLGIKMLRGWRGPFLDASPRGQKLTKRAFWESMTVEILNPKTAIFFLAFLPQFADPAAAFPVWLQLLILGTLVNVIFSSADVVCVVLADKLTGLFKASTRLRMITSRIGGLILIALGINLAVSRQ
ncbi:MAG: LysE family translocator [Pseudomonadota bacterium]